MTDAELTILREAAIGPVRGPRAGEHVAVQVSGGIVSERGGPWARRGFGEAVGWVDNLHEHKGGSLMLYDGETVTAVRFFEVLSVKWRT